MKVSSAAVALLAALPAAALAQECLLGGFHLEFDGGCTPESVLAAYEEQVFGAAGATSDACTLDAAADLNLKLAAAGIDDLQALCDSVYNSQEQVPFTHAAKRGDDMHFEREFFNGHTDWQEEVETIYETEDGTRTSVLKEDAEQVRAFFEGVAQGRRVEWPGALPNFQSSVTDGNDLATCTTNAAMCCWPKDRQANDGNGNCAKEYDENCVDKDPADNTNLCYVDLERGNASTGFDSTDVLVYPGDGGQGEGSIHCHGLAWSNDKNDHTARYKANGLFFVSMYDHMYQRGYVKNVPGAPMCGCVEQMPTVSRSDCTQVDLTETIEMSYSSETKTFQTKLASIHVDFNACQGINHRNNDLWAYMARLYYQGDVTPQQFGELGRIITDTGCQEATNYQLNQHGYTPGYDHDVSLWSNVAGRESMHLHDPYGHRAFNRALTPSGTDDPANVHYGIVYRACQSCIRTHKKIFYRRRTPVPDGFNLIHNILHEGNDGNGQNKWNADPSLSDFSLHSTLEDAEADANPWQCPNDSFNVGENFYGECSPSGARVRNQRSRFNRWNDKRDVAYFVNKAEDDGLQVIDTTHIKGRDWAGGSAVQDPANGDIYMTGSGRDIWWWHDDFNYMSQPAEGDHTVIVHVGNPSSPDPRDWAKSGIQFRKSMETNSANYGIYLTGAIGVDPLYRYGVCPQGRLTTGAYPKGWTCVNTGAEEAWLKIEKRMDTMTSFVGTEEADGSITWTVVDSREMPEFADSYHVGLGVSSARYYPQEVVFSGYEVDAYYFPSAAPSVSGMPTINVASTDIGTAGTPGSARQFDDGSWAVSGAGSDFWGSADSGHYAYFDAPASGNVKVELLVDSFDYVHHWQKGGVMLRESLEANSKHCSLYMTGNQGIANMWRSNTGGNSGNYNNNTLNAKPVWLQVIKVGNTINSAYKYEGDAEWTPFNTITMSFDSGSFFVGIGVTSHEMGRLATLEARELIIEEIATLPPTASPATCDGNDVSCCGSEDVKQADYRGDVAVTQTGVTCQAWARQSPHGHSRTAQNYPDAGLEANYCRNPDGEPRAWCYTTDPNKRWDYCTVPTCAPPTPSPVPATMAPAAMARGLRWGKE